MNEAIQIFRNKQFGSIRTIEENGKVLFCGSDVAKALGYSIPSKAVNTHCKGVSKMEVPTNGGNQTMLFIPEGDVYRLITHSTLPAAEKFEKWVFDEVLPEIRKTGSYGEINIEQVIMQTATAIVSKVMEQLFPLLSEMCSKRMPKPTGVPKPTANRYVYRQPSKIELLPPETKERVDEMLISGNYSCQQVANFIVNETGNYISTQSVTRYKREKLSVVGSCEQERFF